VRQLGMAGGAQRAPGRFWGGGKPGGGIADIKKTQDSILSVFSIGLSPVNY
jgi:hypothetical protein